jgi:hypothetical protein
MLAPVSVPTGVLMMMYISASFEAKVEEGKEE